MSLLVAIGSTPMVALPAFRPFVHLLSKHVDSTTSHINIVRLELCHVHLVCECLSDNLGSMLVVPLPLLAVLDSEPILEDLPDALEWHSLDLGVEEDEEQPAAEADGAIETECAGWCSTLHDAQECRGDDDVRGPAGDGVEHGTDCSDL